VSESTILGSPSPAERRSGSTDFCQFCFVEEVRGGNLVDSADSRVRLEAPSVAGLALRLPAGDCALLLSSWRLAVP